MYKLIQLIEEIKRKLDSHDTRLIAMREDYTNEVTKIINEIAEVESIIEMLEKRSKVKIVRYEQIIDRKWNLVYHLMAKNDTPSNVYKYLKGFVGKKEFINLMESKAFFEGDPFNCTDSNAESIARHLIEPTASLWRWFDPLTKITGEEFIKRVLKFLGSWKINNKVMTNKICYRFSEEIRSENDDKINEFTAIMDKFERNFDNKEIIKWWQMLKVCEEYDFAVHKDDMNY